MKKRKLYIAAYDISSPRRLRKMLNILKGMASGRQKSVFECYLDDAEQAYLMSRIQKVMNPDEDRFVLIPISLKKKICTLGIGTAPQDPDFYYIG